MTTSQTILAGRYRLRETLGQGGMGRVWLATDELLHRQVAVKEVILPHGLTPDEVRETGARASREARAAARLSHPNVVIVYDIVVTDTVPWIVMEYLPSRSLDQAIVQDGPMRPVAAARVGLYVLAAMRAAHQVGVLHRDIKPSNVLLTDSGRVVLTDFGLATIVGDPAVTRTGTIFGSPSYMAPERARDAEANEASDLWSLGATLYFAVEGRSPYQRGSALATVAALASEEPDPATRAGAMQPVLDGLLRRDPLTRLSAADLEVALRMIVHNAPAEPAGPATGQAAAERAAAERPAGRQPAGGQPLKQTAVLPRQRGESTPAQLMPAAAAAAAAGTSEAPAAQAGTRAAAPGAQAGTPEAASPAGPTVISGTPAGGKLSAKAATEAAQPADSKAGTKSTQAAVSDAGERAAEPAVGKPAVAKAVVAKPAVAKAAVAEAGAAQTAAADPAGLPRTTVFEKASAGQVPLQRQLRGDQPVDPGERRIVSPGNRRQALIVTVVSLVLVAVVAGWALTRSEDPVDQAGTGGPATSPSVAASVAPTGAIASSAAPSAATSPSAGPSAETLPEGWHRYTDRTGFSVAVPKAWDVSRSGSMVYFRESGGPRVLGIDQTNSPRPDPVADWTSQERRRVAGGDFPNYQRVRLEKVEYFLNAADWEFTYDSNSTRRHTNNRGFVTSPTKAYGMWWSTLDSRWTEHLSDLELIQRSFKPAA